MPMASPWRKPTMALPFVRQTKVRGWSHPGLHLKNELTSCPPRRKRGFSRITCVLLSDNTKKERTSESWHRVILVMRSRTRKIKTISSMYPHLSLYIPETKMCFSFQGAHIPGAMGDYFEDRHPSVLGMAKVRIWPRRRRDNFGPPLPTLPDISELSKEAVHITETDIAFFRSRSQFPLIPFVRAMLKSVCFLIGLVC